VLKVEGGRREEKGRLSERRRKGEGGEEERKRGGPVGVRRLRSTL